jgi:hypothetical protein
MEWAWGSTEIWDGVRKSAVELVDPANTEILNRDERQRSKTVLNGKTQLIIGESIFEQRDYNAAPYQYYLTSNVQLLEDRMISLTNKEKPRAVSGTLAITGKNVTISKAFNDTLAAYGRRITLQNAGVRANGIGMNNLVMGFLNKNDMANYIFFLLAENSFNVEKVRVTWGNLWQAGSATPRGAVQARAVATIDGRKVPLRLNIKLQ